MQTEGARGKEYYDRFYRDYARQNPPNKLAFYRHLIERAAAGTPRPRVLDLGCAFGGVLSVLDPKWERYGLDINEYAVWQARLSLPGVEFAVSPAADIPFDVAFDVIAAFDLCEHVADLDALACAVRSRLAARERFVFVVPVYDGITGPVIRALDKDDTHVHKSSRWFWLGWAQAHFGVLEWWGVYRYLFRSGYYLHRPTRLLRRCTAAVAVVAGQP